MNLAQLAAATSTKRPNHSLLLYGEPKTGKTRLVGTAAKLKEIKRIFWFDLENGAETLLHMGLTTEEMSKIIIYQIPDTREVPRACETILKCLSAKASVLVCHEHGKVGCTAPECKPAEKSTSFFLRDLTHNDLLVIDSGSQLGDSALAMACIGKPIEYKASFDEYGAAGKYLGDILSVVQQATFTNFVIITHTNIVEEEINGIKRDKVVPLMGTRAFCLKVAKYFGTVIFLEIKLGKHAAGSSSTYKANHVTGSRLDIKVESSKELDMRAILVEGGILNAES